MRNLKTLPSLSQRGTRAFAHLGYCYARFGAWRFIGPSADSLNLSHEKNKKCAENGADIADTAHHFAGCLILLRATRRAALNAVQPRRNSNPRSTLFRVTLAAALTVLNAFPARAAVPVEPASPSSIVATRDGARFFVACATAGEVRVLDARGTVLQSMKMPGAPSGLALSPDGSRLAVTCAAPQSTVCIVDVSRSEIVARLPAGHTTVAPVFSGDGRTLYACNRFNHEVAVFDLAARKQVARIAVDREPIAAALTPDGRLLFVANHLHHAAADADLVTAVVSVIDSRTRRVVKSLNLPNGSGLLLGVAVSPDGRHAAVTHNLSRFNLPTTQLERGWMNTAALTLIDVSTIEVINTVLLDNVESGAANPWAVAWTADGKRLVVTHAGTHEVSLIDFPGVLAKLQQLPIALAAGQTPDFTKVSNVRTDVPNDLAFLVGLRERVKLNGNGPRSLALVGETAWVPGYFSDTVDIVPLTAPASRPTSVPLGPIVAMSTVRRGEMLFNDATLCFQTWQSCATCHSYDGRVDGLNWDLLNDGIGNPKNAKSLLWSHRTPPAMSTGIRDTAEIAVRSGLRYILFVTVPDDVPAALDDYLQSLTPAPSPLLENGRLSKSAQRGKETFEDPKVGCAKCHPPGVFSDLQPYDVGTRRRLDGAGTNFDTPTLVELWRTAPYLHDGSAPSIRDVFIQHNHQDKHGVTSHLSKPEIDDLATYVLSL